MSRKIYLSVKGAQEPFASIDVKPLPAAMSNAAFSRVDWHKLSTEIAAKLEGEDGLRFKLKFREDDLCGQGLGFELEVQADFARRKNVPVKRYMVIDDPIPPKDTSEPQDDQSVGVYEVGFAEPDKPLDVKELSDKELEAIITEADNNNTLSNREMKAIIRRNYYSGGS